MTEFDERLDLTGLHCPLPILKAKKRLHELEAGQILCVLADDPGSVKDFKAFSRQTGNELLELQELPDHYLFLLRKRQG
ncbi:MAG: sulfurtransferase TusA family protein [Gammaproteobacteria bacterium]|nr:sulfurtransferase TusA family protein [Gammaproteobacteria bacterium]